MYVTTGKNPSSSNKNFSRLFASLLLGVYESRGKKSIEQVVRRARRLGARRIAFVHEEDGKPSRILFMRLGRSWEWLRPEIAIKEAKFLAEEVPDADGTILAGKYAERVRELFDFLEPDSDETIVLKCERGSIGFLFKGKKIGLISVRGYEG